MPAKKGKKGKKGLSPEQLAKRSAAKQERAAKRKERAEMRKELKAKANIAYNSWGGAHLKGVVTMCVDEQNQLHTGANTDGFVAVPINITT